MAHTGGPDLGDLSLNDPLGGFPPTANLCVAMVGLPARGKTYVARKVARYLNWLGHKAQIFNVGNYRRNIAGAAQQHSFFDPNHEENNRIRQEIADSALEDMAAWFKEKQEEDAMERKAASMAEGLGGSMSSIYSSSASLTSSSPSLGPRLAVKKSLVGAARVALYDATNSTKERRNRILRRCEQDGIQVMFVEMICDKMDVIMANIKEVKLSSPDYIGIDSEAAVQDFIERIHHYEKTYEPITEDEDEGRISFVKVINVGDKVIVNKVKGYIQSRIVFFLTNLNITPRSIYFSRHGESMFNVEGKIGGDADLSPQGVLFAKKLPELLKEKLGSGTNLTVWTSTLRRTIQTASNLPYPQLQWKALDELDSGVCDGLTYEEIEERFPEDFEERDNDKYNYRYKGGESYADLVRRLEPVTLELERHHEKNHSILIIGHQAVLRALYAYFLNYSHDELPYLKIPLHTVVRLTFKAYGCIEERYKVDVDAVDTHRGPKASPLRALLPEGLPPKSEPVSTLIKPGEKKQKEEEAKKN
ncbi:Fructose-2,6-bisphosphatase [Chytridiales sp. JEL 0842]|nr:Fructose-2,6-bisphosphatase [Chytridiales sp. JEL 0842]